jgi:hypothetical protein
MLHHLERKIADMAHYGLWVLVTVVLLAAPASAARRPSFDLDYSAWKATHVILVTEGPTIDGKLDVIESWKGDLAPGSQATVPALAAFADEGTRQVYRHGLRDLPEPYVRSVTGARMVLFLTRTSSPQDGGPPGPALDGWQAASQFGDFDTSVVWIERGEAYAYRQSTNPGPSRIEHDSSVIEMKVRIACLTMIQSELQIAIRENDPIRAAQVFRACHQYNFFGAARESIISMGNMGDRSVAALRPLLRDITTVGWYPTIIAAMAKAGGRTVSSDLIDVIREDLSFWSEEAPNLKDDWWNVDPDDHRQLRRLHYERLLQTLQSLAAPVEASDRSLIVKTRNLWRTTAALASVDKGRIAGACNALLQEPSTDHK